MPRPDRTEVALVERRNGSRLVARSEDHIRRIGDANRLVAVALDQCRSLTKVARTAYKWYREEMFVDVETLIGGRQYL